MRFILSAAGAVLLSFVAKLAADNVLIGNPQLLHFGNFPVGLHYAQNPGVAFGLQLPTSLQTPIILAALLLIAAVAWVSRPGFWGQLGFGLLLGGALANVIDRLRDGLVTDFFQVGTFPIFNVADSCITIGVCLLFIAEFVHRPRS